MRRTVLIRFVVTCLVALSVGFGESLQPMAVSHAQTAPVPGRPGPAAQGHRVNPGQLQSVVRSPAATVEDPPGNDGDAAPDTLSPAQQSGPVSQTAILPAWSAAATGTATAFAGTDMNGSCAPNKCFKVPDGAIAVGPTYIVEIVNQAFSVYTRSGTLVLGPVSLQAFFGSVGVPYDVRVLYDAGNRSTNGYGGGFGRYILVALARGVSSSQDLVAVSQNDSPTNQASWCTYSLKAAIVANGVFSGADYQGLGLDGQNVYTTVAETAFGTGSFEGTRILAIPKSSIYPDATTGNCPAASSTEFDTITNPDSTLAYAILPANRPSAAAGSQVNMYFVNTQYPNGGVLENKLAWRTVAVSNGVLTLNPPHWVTVAAYNNPASAPQPDGTKLNEGDTFLTGAVYRNGQIYTSNSTRHVSGPTSGVNPYSSVQWYVFTPSPKVTSATTYYLTDPVMAYFHPQVVVACTTNTNPCSSTLYTALEVTGVSPGQPPSAYWYVPGAGPTILAAGTASWKYTSSWGDYPGVSVDPNTQSSVWLEGEYAETGSTWGTAITRVCSGSC